MSNSLYGANSRRNQFLDIAKGLGIIFVVLGHLADSGQFMRILFYSFHMPMFFIVSGALYRPAKSFKACLNSSFRKLFVPYICLVVADTIIVACDQISSNGINWLNLFNKEFYSLILSGFSMQNRAAWFIPAMFLIRLAYHFLSKNKWTKATAILLGVIVLVISKFVDLNDYCRGTIYLIFLPGLSFYAVGDILKKYIVNFPEYLKKHRVSMNIALAVCIVIFAFTVRKNGMVSMLSYMFSNQVLYVVNSLIGTYIFFCLCSYLLVLNNTKLELVNNMLCYYGRNSLYVLMVHHYLCRRTLPMLAEKIGLMDYIYTPAGILILFVIVMLLMVPFIYLFDNYCGAVFGVKNKKKKQTI